ncbi:hypothetical protein ABPG74_009414 [Tetrahymena malaccensis]
MNRTPILILLAILLVNIQQTRPQFVNSCLQDEVDMSKIVPKDYLETFDENFGNRKLYKSDPQPIRITLDFKELDNPQNGEGLTPNVKEYIKKIMFAAQTYLNKLIKVYPRQQPNKFIWGNDECYDVLIPEYVKTYGVDQSDLHIFVTYSNEPKYSYLANATWCQLDPNPNIGRVKLNIGTINTDESSTQSFQDNFSTSLHEILHVLGFSGGSVQFWIDPETNKPYGVENAYKVVKRERRWEVDNVLKISSKNLLKVSRNHYSCPSIDGMYLENQGGRGSMGSHWERDLLGNEFMTGSIVYGIYSVSKFTAALLLDTGYYAEINSNLLMPIYWGKNKGCDFFNKTCKAGKYFPEFPDDSISESCDFFSQGIGSPQNFDYFSQCKTIAVFSGQCKSDYFQPNERLRQNTGTGSRCFRSNANIKGDEVLDMKGRCFKAQCANDLSSIKVNIWDDEFVTCKYPNQVINLSDQTKTTQGTMKCPHDFDLFCNFPKSCPNNCSSKGICNNGYCVCLKGYAGADCSKACDEDQAWDGARCVQNCPTGQFKNLDNTCKSTCPYKQFGDQSTGSCALCSVNCSACFGPSSNQCLACNDGYSLQGNQCVDTTCHSSCQSCSGPNQNQCTSCPAGSYLDSRKTCQPCQQPCENCFNSATECTTCGQGYEMDKFLGKCVSMNTCDSSCLECSANRDPTKCTSCRDGQFVNQEGRCQKCEKFCATCSEREDKCITCAKGWDQYDAQNKRCYFTCHNTCSICTAGQDPTACVRCSFNHIMLNNLCVPCDKSCYGCRDDPKSCTECQRGYELDPNSQTCVPICRSNEFQDRNGNCQKCTSPCETCQSQSYICNSCITGYTYDAQKKSCKTSRNDCHESCGQCNRYDDPNACTSCRKGMYLQSGRCQYCRDKCQTCDRDANNCTSCRNNQFLQNKECMKCHISCLTCSGISTNCTSCYYGFTKDPKTGLCVDIAPICKDDEYFDVNNSCQKCSSPCASCSYFPTRCSSCISGYKYNNERHSCEVVCQPGQYIDRDQKCKACSAPCETCEYYNNRCLSCISGYTYNNYYCQQNAKSNLRGCHESCNTCKKAMDPRSCDSCREGYELKSGSCLKKQ